MNNDRRQLLIKVAAAVVGLYALDAFVIEPAIDGWREQNRRIVALGEKVQRGRQLRERETSIRERWAGMLRANLPAEVSAAESMAQIAVGRWVSASQISLTSLTPQWQSREDGFDLYECRVTATGSQTSLGRFIYELETDQSAPVNLEECELASRDARGAQLTLTARLTFLRIKDPKKTTP